MESKKSCHAGQEREKTFALNVQASERSEKSPPLRRLEREREILSTVDKSYAKFA